MLEAVSPVPPTLALAFAGGRSLLRKVYLHQTRTADAVALVLDGAPLALAMLQRQRARRRELAIAFAPAAPAHMRRLVRFAQLTLCRIAQTGTLVFVRIAPGNAQARRMAALTGFSHGGFVDPSIWLWKRR